MTTPLVKCRRCGTPIAYGRIESGNLEILCKRCGEKTRVPADKKVATLSAVA